MKKNDSNDQGLDFDCLIELNTATGEKIYFDKITEQLSSSVDNPDGSSKIFCWGPSRDWWVSEYDAAGIETYHRDSTGTERGARRGHRRTTAIIMHETNSTL